MAPGITRPFAARATKYLRSQDEQTVVDASHTSVRFAQRVFGSNNPFAARTMQNAAETLAEAGQLTRRSSGSGARSSAGCSEAAIRTLPR